MQDAGYILVRNVHAGSNPCLGIGFVYSGKVAALINVNNRKANIM